MARTLSKKVWTPMFEGTFIGPVKIIAAATPKQKFEARCHKCHWSKFENTNEQARDIILWHLDTAHFNPPPPYVFHNTGGIG